MEQSKDVNNEKDDYKLNQYNNQNPMLVVMDDLIKSIQQVGQNFFVHLNHELLLTLIHNILMSDKFIKSKKKNHYYKLH